jgi:guanine nucleotide-binding protein subunit alpha
MLSKGCGESGKSTVLKQMKMYHKKAFNETEMQQFRKVLRQNLITALRNIYEGFQGTGEKFELEVESSLVEEIWEHDCEEQFPENMVKIIVLWSSESEVRKAAKTRSAEFRLDDSAI